MRDVFDDIPVTADDMAAIITVLVDDGVDAVQRCEQFRSRVQVDMADGTIFDVRVVRR